MDTKKKRKSSSSTGYQPYASTALRTMEAKSEGEGDDEDCMAAMAASDPPSTKNYSSASSEPLRRRDQETARFWSRRSSSRIARIHSKGKRNTTSGAGRSVRLPVAKDKSRDDLEVVAAQKRVVDLGE